MRKPSILHESRALYAHPELAQQRPVPEDLIGDANGEIEKENILREELVVLSAAICGKTMEALEKIREEAPPYGLLVPRESIALGHRAQGDVRLTDLDKSRPMSFYVLVESISHTFDRAVERYLEEAGEEDRLAPRLGEVLRELRDVFLGADKYAPRYDGVKELLGAGSQTFRETGGGLFMVAGEVVKKHIPGASSDQIAPIVKRSSSLATRMATRSLVEFSEARMALTPHVGVIDVYRTEDFTLTETNGELRVTYKHPPSRDLTGIPPFPPRFNCPAALAVAEQESPIKHLWNWATDLSQREDLWDFPRIEPPRVEVEAHM